MEIVWCVTTWNSLYLYYTNRFIFFSTYLLIIYAYAVCDGDIPAGFGAIAGFGGNFGFSGLSGAGFFSSVVSSAVDVGAV